MLKERQTEGSDTKPGAEDKSNAQEPELNERPAKKQKLDKDQKKALKEERRAALDPKEDEAIRQEKANKRREQNRRKKEAKKEQRQKVKDKRKSKKERSKETDAVGTQNKDTAQKSEKQKQTSNPSQKAPSPRNTQDAPQSELPENHTSNSQDADMENFEGFGDQDQVEDKSHSIRSSPEQENVFDNLTNASSASSSSSIVPPSDPSPAQNPVQSEFNAGLRKQDVDKDDSFSSDESDAEASDSEQLGDRIELPLDTHAKVTLPLEGVVADELPESKVGGSIQQNPTNGACDDATEPDESTEPSGTSDVTDHMPKIDHKVLTKRLSDKLAALRAARKADGPDGKPAKNRAELLEARRKKADLRKQRKKEQRARDREAKDAETEAARLRGGDGSPVWSPSMYSPGGALAKQNEPNLQFSRVAFEDGTTGDASGSILTDGKTKKGPSDPKTALAAAENKKARIASYDAEKRANIEEKEAWAHARKRVAGEKEKDDPNLLKKTLKRKQKSKGKSEKAWNERLDGVRKSQEMKQKKREDNLRKRKEEKGVKAKDRKVLGKSKGKDGVQKRRKRPGFEGTFKSSAK